ncbi:hypothetical protein [Shewanella algae]|uniref:hypothetical protein n=1 Tax=Shewanella algae TaxID=38313 RepID=UPI0031F4FEB9
MRDIATIGDLLSLLRESAAEHFDMGLGEFAGGIEGAIRLIKENLDSDTAIGEALEQSDPQELEAAKSENARLKQEIQRLRGILGRYEERLQHGIAAVSEFYGEKMGYQDVKHRLDIYPQTLAFSKYSTTPGTCPQCHGVGRYKPVSRHLDCMECDKTGVDFKNPGPGIQVLTERIRALNEIIVKQDATVFAHAFSKAEQKNIDWRLSADSLALFYEKSKNNIRLD